MSRTRRNKRPRMSLGDEAKRYQYRNGKVRDGTPQHASGSCQNHGGCPVCEGNRLHKHKKQMSTSNDYKEKRIPD